MAATMDSVDLLGTDLAHPRLRMRPAAPLAPPPRSAERLPAAMPATAEMEAPVWPGVESAPPVRARTQEPPPARPAPPAVRSVPSGIQEQAPTPPRATTPPPVPARLAAASVVPRQGVVEVVVPERPAAESAFDAETAAWFAEDPAAEPYADPYFEERPAGLPWWAVAIPASAALGVVAMVVTALALVASRSL